MSVEIDGDGARPASWRRAAHSPDQLLIPRRVARVAAAAGNAGYTLVTTDDSVLPPAISPDSVGRIGAVERATFVAASTSTIGIAPFVPVTYAEPFHASSQLASLDHISAGRARWVVTEDDRAEAALAWGRPLVAGADARARESRDGVEVARTLWDSWEDDAVIRSMATSRYFDRERLHYIDLTGETYAVMGPAIVPRPPQGQLVALGGPDRVSAAQLDVVLVEGRDLAAVTAAAAAPAQYQRPPPRRAHRPTQGTRPRPQREGHPLGRTPLQHRSLTNLEPQPPSAEGGKFRRRTATEG
ncbi:LLM class flavin-dependent oxidoreductase [Streptomyces monashensis]|uniref:LLM class flavin-dependent oxidoreductase n=1 Tax=Streptomyces monashensis TaxID=1678012 RepID=UPI0033CFB2BE